MSTELAPAEKYNTPIPAKITTPDLVDTRIGMLEFTDGMPSAETAAVLWDHLDFIRGVEVFLNCIPAASLEAMHLGMRELGLDACHKVAIADELLDSNPLFLTGNTDTVYASVILDLERDGPTVVEIPPGCGPGTVNDAWFRFVVDMGAPGPDRGAGGRYLIVPEGHDGEIPDGYFVAESPSSINWLILRGFLVDGKPDTASTMFRDGLRVYPLAAADAPPEMEFISLSQRPINTIHANDFEFYEEVARVIAREPIGVIDPETRGLLAAIGIQKGEPFAPDDRMRAILTEAAAVGNATARTIDFRNRDPEVLVYDDRRWMTGFLGGDYRWLRDDGRGGRHLDARTLFFYLATVNTPAMALKMVGVGSQYAGAMVDVDGLALDGALRYRLRLPPEVPAKEFWSIVAYDPQTRSELQTSQPFPSLNSERDDLHYNEDGSVDIVFGPEPPEEHPENWIQTVAGKGWFILLRLYGPLEAWFDQTWRPDDIQASLTVDRHLGVTSVRGSRLGPSGSVRSGQPGDQPLVTGSGDEQLGRGLDAVHVLGVGHHCVVGGVGRGHVLDAEDPGDLAERPVGVGQEDDVGPGERAHMVRGLATPLDDLGYPSVGRGRRYHRGHRTDRGRPVSGLAVDDPAEEVL